MTLIYYIQFSLWKWSPACCLFSQQQVCFIFNSSTCAEKPETCHPPWVGASHLLLFIDLMTHFTSRISLPLSSNEDATLCRRCWFSFLTNQTVPDLVPDTGIWPHFQSVFIQHLFNNLLVFVVVVCPVFSCFRRLLGQVYVACALKTYFVFVSGFQFEDGL